MINFYYSLLIAAYSLYFMFTTIYSLYSSQFILFTFDLLQFILIIYYSLHNLLSLFSIYYNFFSLFSFITKKLFYSPAFVCNLATSLRGPWLYLRRVSHLSLPFGSNKSHPPILFKFVLFCLILFYFVVINKINIINVINI